MGCRKLKLNDYFRFVGNESEIQYSESQHRKDRPTGFSTYDSLNRLTKEVSECADKAELAYTDEYTYDLVGNRLSKCSSGFQPETLTYTYNANDQLTLESSSTKGDTIYSYDANGSQIGKVNETQNESYLYTYNLQNRLASATITRTETDPMGGSKLVDITSSYAYNQSGIRVRSNTTQTVDGGMPEVKNTTYLTDPANFTGYSQVLEESTNGTLTKSYTIGDDVLSQSSFQNSSTPEIKNFLYDGHGSTRLLTSATSAISARYNYDAYGKNLFSANVTSPAATDMLYSGEQFDPNLQMQYLRARYYDQNNGRFNRLDPFGGNNYDPQSLHKYGYAHSEPVNGKDPSGLMTLLETMAVGAIVNICFTAMNIGIKAAKEKAFPSVGDIIRQLVIAGVSGAIASAAGYGMALFMKSIGFVAIVQGAAGGSAGAFTAQFISEFVDIYVNDKSIDIFDVGIHIAVATILGGITGGLLTHISLPEVKVPDGVLITNTWLVKFGHGFKVIGYQEVSKLAGLYGLAVASGVGFTENLYSTMIKDLIFNKD